MIDYIEYLVLNVLTLVGKPTRPSFVSVGQKQHNNSTAALHSFINDAIAK